MHAVNVGVARHPFPVIVAGATPRRPGRVISCSLTWWTQKHKYLSLFALRLTSGTDKALQQL